MIDKFSCIYCSMNGGFSLQWQYKNLDTGCDGSLNVLCV